MKTPPFLALLMTLPLMTNGQLMGQESRKATQRGNGLHGYIGFRASRPPRGSDYGAGIGFYAAVWSLIDRPIAGFQIGLPGTWITPDNSDNKDTPLAPIGTHAGITGPNEGQPMHRSFRRSKAASAIGPATGFDMVRQNSA